MYINTYGDDKLPKIILLHPMMVSGENLFHIMSRYFKGEYCFIAPDQGGHGKSKGYKSLFEETNILKKYLIDNSYTDIKLLYGASLGVAVAYELMKDETLHFEKIWLDGASFAENAVVMNYMMKTMFLKRKKAFEKNFNMKSTMVETYGEEFGNMMKDNFKRMTSSDITEICNVCCRRDLKHMTKELQESTHIEWGESDPDYSISKKNVRKYFPHARVVLRKGYGHCVYMALQTQPYAEEIEQFISAV